MRRRGAVKQNRRTIRLNAGCKEQTLICDWFMADPYTFKLACN